MVSAFDPQAFLDATITEVNEKRQPLPTENPGSADGLYTAVIGEIKMASGVSKEKGTPWLQAIVPLKVQVPQQLQDSLKLPAELLLTDRPFIQLTDQGLIDNAPGKNRGQRQYRDATGMNQAGATFAWRRLEGQPVKFKMTHEMYEGEIQERIGGVFKP